jgi:SsrA-binding protein
MKQRAENKRAFFDYEILDRLVAGLALTGAEVKAARAGQALIKSAFVRPLVSGAKRQVELWLVNSHFSNTPEPSRSRKLLLHRSEIDRLTGRVSEKGLTLIPIAIFFSKGKLKLELGIGKGKKQFEKRETIRRRDIDREVQRSLKQ